MSAFPGPAPRPGHLLGLDALSQPAQRQHCQAPYPFNRKEPGNFSAMATSSKPLDPSAQPASGMTLQTDEAKATAAEIVTENAALDRASQSAEAQAEAVTAQAGQMAEATEEVLEELQEIEERAEQA